MDQKKMTENPSGTETKTSGSGKKSDGKIKIKNNYRKTPTVFQMEATECGAASLAMILGYYGCYVPLEQMRIDTGVSRDGCSAMNILRAARSYGLEGKGLRTNLAALKTIPTPCILHWNGNHFVVFEGFRRNHAYINDPAVGRRKVTMEDLNSSFTGIVLTFALTPEFRKIKKRRSAGALLSGRLRGQYAVLFQLFYIGILLVFPGLVLPLLSQVFVDDVLINGYTDRIAKILLFMGLLVLMKFGLTWYRSLSLQKLKSKMILLSGHAFLRKLMRLPMSFFDQRNTGDLVCRMQSNTAVSNFFAGELAETLLNLLISVFYLAVLFLYNPVMTLIGLGNVAVCLLAVFFSKRFLTDASVKIQMSSGRLYGAVSAGLGITDSLKASGAEDTYTARLLGHQAKLAGCEQEMYRFQQILNAIPSAVGAVTDAVLLLAGGLFVIRGEMTMGMLMAFHSLFDSFCEPVNALVFFVQKIQTLKANLRRVEDIENYPQDEIFLPLSQTSQNFRKLNGEIDLINISYGYSSLKPPLIERFSFHLNSGETIAFVGASGSGKSTVAKMISGLYRPWGGQRLFDGVPLEQIPRDVINASISTVSQNIALFSGTIRENLTMWNPAVSEEDMIRAAKDACIHSFIETLPGGYNYRLTENASNLSGGQKQRIEIARALAVNPSILIMDEATRALDPIVEKQVLDNIRRRGCTCVVVAHRLSAIRDANEIVVMHHGHIIQRGTHQSLMAEENSYYRGFVQNI